jgi:hypothetical protein
MGGITQDDGYVRGVAPTQDRSSGSFLDDGGVPEGRVYGRRLVFVSVRTNKSHHHLLLGDSSEFSL